MAINVNHAKALRSFSKYIKQLDISADDISKNFDKYFKEVMNTKGYDVSMYDDIDDIYNTLKNKYAVNTSSNVVNETIKDTIKDTLNDVIKETIVTNPNNINVSANPIDTSNVILNQKDLANLSDDYILNNVSNDKQLDDLINLRNNARTNGANINNNIGDTSSIINRAINRDPELVQEVTTKNTKNQKPQTKKEKEKNKRQRQKEARDKALENERKAKAELEAKRLEEERLKRVRKAQVEESINKNNAKLDNAIENLTTGNIADDLTKTPFTVESAINNKNVTDGMEDILGENIKPNKTHLEEFESYKVKNYEWDGSYTAQKAYVNAEGEILEEATERIAKNVPDPLITKFKDLSALDVGASVVNVATTIGTYKEHRRQGKGVISSAVRAGASFAMYEALGLWAIPVTLVKEAPGAIIKGAETLYKENRRMNSAASFQVFGNAQFQDTQQLATMRQSGMEMAKMSQYNLQQTLMGNEATYLHR